MAATLAALSVIQPASGATACATRVLRDWSDDGHVASRYSPPCYEEAIDALPTDLRDYTNAQDVINRALTQAVRKSDDGSSARQSEAASPRVTSGNRPVPLGLVAVAVAAAVLLGAGVGGYLLRRSRDSTAT